LAVSPSFAHFAQRISRRRGPGDIGGTAFSDDWPAAGADGGPGDALRGIFDRFGVPGFMAAYNAGPEQVEGVLSGAMGLCCTNGVMARLPLYPGRPIPRFL
jgi:hypothetical protein